MSGTAPSCSDENRRPVRPNPVGISSKTSSVPVSSQLRRTACQKPGAAISGTARIGSAITAATSPCTFSV